MTDEKSFPDHRFMCMMLSKANHMRVQVAHDMSISQKRKCFNAMRLFMTDIHPSLIISPIGLTVSDLSISSALG